MIKEIKSTKVAINLTVVIRPDAPVSDIRSLDRDTSGILRPLKDHLCHRASLPPAWDYYSLRTRQRIARAEKVFTVQKEIFCARHMIIADWQDQLRDYRQIPLQSSPNRTHFKDLASAEFRLSKRLGCITLRRNDSNSLCGIFIALQDSQTGTWHAHSSLGNEQARANFGMYLLFDRALRYLRDADVWLGGAPGGNNGAGVFNFKRRFANSSAFAHILSLDLAPALLRRLRKKTGIFPYYPDYRNPESEKLHC
ncbi:hypothetical protein [Pseudotabrizicola sp. 4114]|uniref:hypothetical protein n=1 Tax=Pseudotabrizicola sp. 4114 TaxID=2817731 RepID=UPI0032B809FF